jgi:RNA polymerase sigma factor (sigma-70 family)
MQMVAAGPVGAASEFAALAAQFDDFYEAEYQPLLRLAYVLTGSTTVAEELVQETMLRAYRHWSKVSAYDKPGAWGRRVLINLATSRGRRLTAEARALVRFRGGHAPVAEPRAENAEVWAALRKLPARQAQAMALFYVEDLAIGDIASLLECPEGTVKALLHRGRQTLARELGETSDETEEEAAQ